MTTPGSAPPAAQPPPGPAQPGPPAARHGWGAVSIVLVGAFMALLANLGLMALALILALALPRDIPVSPGRPR